jgi:hypothetical protein
LPEYRAELCSALCGDAFSSAEYLEEANAVTLANARRDPFDPARPALARSKFDQLVMEALGPLSPMERHASFYSKIDSHKLEEACRRMTAWFTTFWLNKNIVRKSLTTGASHLSDAPLSN